MTDNPDIILIDGAAVLSRAEQFIRRFCVFPDEHCLIAVTLWAAHTHMVEYFHTTPRLALLSPEPGSGKTRVLEILHLLTPNPLLAVSASTAATFRVLSTEQTTLLFDETDAIFAKRGSEDSNEDLRALLNAGYKRGASIPRCVGPKHDVVQFQVFAATALAGLGDLPDTIMSRSVIIRMRRRGPGEQVEPFRSRVHDEQGHKVRAHLAEWAYVVGPTVGDAFPTMPEGVVDRPQEVWEPLLAVAEAAGGPWPERARAACVALVKVASERRASLGLRLLADLRTVFGTDDVLPTATILDRLKSPDHGLEPDAPWSELHGKGLGERGLATMLRAYGITSTKIKTQGRALQGYRREHLHDAWSRYLPSLSPKEVEPPEPPEPFGREVPQVPQVPLISPRERRHQVPQVPQVPANSPRESQDDDFDDVPF